MLWLAGFGWTLQESKQRENSSFRGVDFLNFPKISTLKCLISSKDHDKIYLADDSEYSLPIGPNELYKER